MKSFALISCILALVSLVLPASAIRGLNKSDGPASSEERTLKVGKKPARTVYSKFFDAAGAQTLTGINKLFLSYDGTGNGGLSDDGGKVYLLAVVYNYADRNDKDFSAIYDNKLTFIFDTTPASSLVVEGVFDQSNIGVDESTFFAITGGTGEYKNARGQAVAGTDGTVNTYTFYLS